MKKLLALTLALFTFATSAQEFKLPENLSVTGFAYTTQFSNKDWQDGHTIAAANIDYFSGNFAARTQLSTMEGHPFRRLVAEYSHPIGSKTEMVYQLGRFSRPNSFYEGVTESPANYRQAIMPMAGYSYRMYYNAFSLMDGLSTQAVFKGNDSLIKAKINYGWMSIPSQDDLQKEAFKRTYGGYLINSDNNNYDLGLSYEIKDWQAYMSRNQYKMRDTSNGTALANAAYNLVATIDYRLDKMGLQYDNQKYVGQIEWFHDFTRMDNPKGAMTAKNNSVGFNWMGGWYINDNWQAYLGRSYGRNKVSKSQNMDNYVGVTWLYNKWTVSTEFHQGNGFAWRKYDAPFVALPNVPSWNSFALSVTYRF